MITRKELGYINNWPSRVPYPGETYCIKVMEKLKKCFELYNKDYLNRKYTIQFSNNEEIDFEILYMNICHMLGVDYKNLMKDIFTNYRSNILRIAEGTQIDSYTLLQTVVDNAEDIIEYDRQRMACMGLNYYKIGIKCDIFSKLADLSGFHYGCINFDKDTFARENPTLTFTPNATKYLYTPSDEVVSPYFMMGLKQDEHSMDVKYIVETLIACEDPYKFFAGQEVVIPTQILTDINGFLAKNSATPDEKIKLLREYQNIIHEYKIANGINIYGDYFSMLMSQKNQGQELVLK